MIIAALLGGVLAVVVFTVAIGEPSTSSVLATAQDKQSVTGPTWTLPPTPVLHTLFGVTINSSTGLMPSFDIGAVRLWDSGTRWADVEPSRPV